MPLYVVATPIGHPKDITLRALEVLQSVDAVICEERREGSTLLKKLGIQKELYTLNEHDEPLNAEPLVKRLKQGQSFALISDCGTPVFSDPGHLLVAAASRAGVQIIPVPGASSLMAALSVCDFKVERFLYEGFLPRDKPKRILRLKQLRAMHIPVALMDTPYRLRQLLEEIAEIYTPTHPIILACDLTLPTERIHRGPVGGVLKQINEEKQEFVVIVK
jgi:16S rRNA (cytidine1402-2'-O)-methyltransferase